MVFQGMRVAAPVTSVVLVSITVVVKVVAGVRVAVVSEVGEGVGVTVGGTGRKTSCHEARIVWEGSEDGHCSVLMPVAMGRADCAMATA
jgi:hypothetical protein